MEHKNSLGLYISNDSATAVVLAGHTSGASLVGAVSVKLTDPENDDQPKSYEQLAVELSKALSQKNLKFDSAAAAVDCSLYTQHTIRSEFKERRQIASTISFDAEEAVATDATRLAVTFNIVAADAIGSYVSTFTAGREEMTDLLKSLLSKSIDPTAIEPDVASLVRFFERYIDDQTPDNSLYVMATETACYLIKPSTEYEASTRSFIVTPTQNKTSVLKRELPLTIASLNEDVDITKLYLIDTTESIDTESLADVTTAQIEPVDLLQLTGASGDLAYDIPEIGHIAFAWGAALGDLTFCRRTDFREDFMPYQGRQKAIRTCLRTMSVCATVILLAIGAHFHLKLKTAEYQADGIQAKLIEQYKGAMHGKPPAGKIPIVSKLKSERNKLKNQKSGLALGDENSMPAKLTFILSALNDENLKNADLTIDQISINENNMTIRGNTPSKIHTLKLYTAIDENENLKRVTDRSSRSGNRDVFTVTLERQ
ncbi:Type II secretory pathway, component PulL [Anaerohalosphaera lusitana]|uniref:Type II secretory pathway, component PulL n=1 Tax=Anaerohalosphaera lusitana TaxID=1936003 RepID=A0A1U9NP03_9BACT|nr:hypothetical protein [Anaerohalosphaera lusitana]AQT69643.1 Type II secretory pathway, component PulL [Anaerohalosphaera lusitana]